MPNDDITFPKHSRPNESCLEPYRRQIAAQRRACWPYNTIARWLADTHELHVDWSTIRNFCNVRNIHKGSGEVGVTRTPTSRAAKTSKADDDDAWHFDTKGPLVLNRP